MRQGWIVGNTGQSMLRPLSIYTNGQKCILTMFSHNVNKKHNPEGFFQVMPQIKQNQADFLGDRIGKSHVD